jgi:hypothetical protein
MTAQTKSATTTLPSTTRKADGTTAQAQESGAGTPAPGSSTGDMAWAAGGCPARASLSCLPETPGRVPILTRWRAQNSHRCAAFVFIGTEPTLAPNGGTARVLPGQPPSLTVTDPPGARTDCRGTTRGTSPGRISVQCVLSGHWRVLSAQVERPERPSSPLLIRGFGVRVPGGAPVLTWAISHIHEVDLWFGLQLGCS